MRAPKTSPPWAPPASALLTSALTPRCPTGTSGRFILAHVETDQLDQQPSNEQCSTQVANTTEDKLHEQSAWIEHFLSETKYDEFPLENSIWSDIYKHKSSGEYFAKTKPVD
jgi:hypothetical protein